LAVALFLARPLYFQSLVEMKTHSVYAYTLVEVPSVVD